MRGRFVSSSWYLITVFLSSPKYHTIQTHEKKICANGGFANEIVTKTRIDVLLTKVIVSNATASINEHRRTSENAEMREDGDFRWLYNGIVITFVFDVIIEIVPLSMLLFLSSFRLQCYSLVFRHFCSHASTTPIALRISILFVSSPVEIV